MRLSAREINPTVVVAPDTARPIRLKTGALTYGFTPDQAISLATLLADAVAELNEGKTL